MYMQIFLDVALYVLERVMQSVKLFIVANVVNITVVPVFSLTSDWRRNFLDSVKSQTFLLDRYVKCILLWSKEAYIC